MNEAQDEVERKARMKRQNRSGLKPLGRAVLVEAYEPERAKSVIAMPDNLADKEKMLESRAVVIETGISCWCDEPEPRAIVGDKVLISRFAGVMAKGPADGKQYRLVNDRDIYCRITEEKVL